MIIVLLSFSESLATKCVSINDEPCMIVIDLNPFELKYYPFMIILDKCSGSCNSGNDLSTKICVPGKTKDKNGKAFNMIKNRNNTKTMANTFLVTVNAKSIVQHVIQIKNGIIKSM